MNSKERKLVGHILFGIGLILALVSGLVSILVKNSKVLMILYLLVSFFGLITGYHNIKRKELNTYLIASLVLIITLNNFYSLIEYVGRGLGLVSLDNLYSFLEPFSKIINSLIIFISSASLIPALKAVFRILED
jgi:hypothetical protein